MVLYVFGRTHRDKEAWFRRLVYAAHSMTYPTNFAAIPTTVDRGRDKAVSVYTTAADQVRVGPVDYGGMVPPHQVIADYLR